MRQPDFFTVKMGKAIHYSYQFLARKLCFGNGMQNTENNNRVYQAF